MQNNKQEKTADYPQKLVSINGISAYLRIPAKYCTYNHIEPKDTVRVQRKLVDGIDSIVVQPIK